MTITETHALAPTWVDVCPFDWLISGRGVCALVGGHQVAVFRVDDELFALSNFDPFSQSFVLSRGIVGSRGDRLKVASPIFKQSFDLHTGACLDDATVSVATYAARVSDGQVQVACP
ncbi:MAG: nitrite reductase small subunit [Acidimicrobiaceae bacterium]|jgi:nitrite reductase (NADH) small subunit|nr:nitrite reductase small subunit [Acidimicrobiaceae bacterium]